MLDQLIETMSEKKNLALLTAGMIGLTAGGKAAPVALFVKGAMGLEDEWRKAHPDFHGGLADRWREAIEFYDETHQDSTNRVLHTVGIPMILGGAAGMLASPRYTPPWWIANGSWTVGWALNFAGHGLFENGPPAFASDPLSFLAGPMWDLLRVKDRMVEAVRGPERPVDTPPTQPAAS